MKRQLVALSLATVSALSLVAPQFAQAATLQKTIIDKEDNGTQPQNLGQPTFDTAYNLQGSLGQSTGGTNQDQVDNYSFVIGRAGQYKLNLGGNFSSGNAELRLYFNNSLIANNKPGQPIDRVLQPGNYRLEVFRTPSSSGQFNYGVAMITPPSPPVSLTMISAKALDQFDTTNPFGNTERADFFVTSMIDGQAMPKSKKIEENNNPIFNHTVTAQVSGGDKVTVPITLRLVDDDTGSTDTADISPDAAQRELQLTYVVGTGEVFGPGGRLGRLGETIPIQGATKNRGSIAFRFNAQ